jgi:predicted extracellular nuclease
VPLAVTFKEVRSDEVFTVVVNHLKSKGSAGAAELQTMIQMTELLTLTKQDLMLLQP